MTKEENQFETIPEVVDAIRQAITNGLVDSGVFSRTKLENLNDNDFGKVLATTNIPILNDMELSDYAILFDDTAHMNP